MAAIVFFSSFLPGLFYLWVVWRLDKYDPEPKKWIAFTFFLGILSTFPAALSEQLIDMLVFPYWEGSLRGDLFSVFVSSFFIIGPVEEFCKMGAILVVASNKKVFNEPMDALVYGGAAALGFASMENAIYCIRFGSEIYIMRAILTVPAHILFATAWAWGIGMWRFRIRGVRGLALFFSCFSIAVGFHGFYDAMLLSRDPTLILSIFPLILFMGLLTFLAFYHFRKVSPFRWSMLPTGIRTAQQISAKEKIEQGLSVGWVAGGTFIYGVIIVTVMLIAGAIGAVFSGGETIVFNLLKPGVGPGMIMSLVLFTLVLSFSFLVAGIIIGRVSKRRTIFEPAIASSIALALLFVVLAPKSGTPGLLMFLFMGPIFFGLSCLGGWLGGMWQAKSENS